jgi:hypothetical protein
VTDDKRSAWLQKLEEEWQYQVALPQRQLMDDSAIMDLLLSYVDKLSSGHTQNYRMGSTGGEKSFRSVLDAAIFLHNTPTGPG